MNKWNTCTSVKIVSTTIVFRVAFFAEYWAGEYWVFGHGVLSIFLFCQLSILGIDRNFYYDRMEYFTMTECMFWEYFSRVILVWNFWEYFTMTECIFWEYFSIMEQYGHFWGKEGYIFWSVHQKYGFRLIFEVRKHIEGYIY